MLSQTDDESAGRRRSTKIVATLGPASSDLDILVKMVEAGVDVVRMNFSHGTPEEHRARAELVHEACRITERTVGVIADLQGPKIRIGTFLDGHVELEPGATFVLDMDETPGDPHRVNVDYAPLSREVSAGDMLMLNDGLITLEVEKIVGDAVHTRVGHGGRLSSDKGINLRGGGLSAEALTDKDREDIRTAAQLKADYIAVSFPKSGEDMRLARSLLREAGSQALLLAKIERADAVEMDAFEDILEASDGIIVARGDLAVEVGHASVPGLQKRMIRLARERNKLTLVATQMMESMVNAPVPTRAEVSDVANAVLDGTDAVMLSAESAVGRYPVETVEAMSRICRKAERTFLAKIDRDFLNRATTRIDQSIAMAALFTAHHLDVKAIAALTESGATALWMSRVDCGVPIYALTPQTATRYRVSLFRDVYPLMLSHESGGVHAQSVVAVETLLASGAVVPGDLIVLTFGEPVGQPGGSNTMKIVRVGASPE